MKTIFRYSALVGVGLGMAGAAAGAGDLQLWYQQSAEKWESEALPVGNGRMGGMIFGGLVEEHLQFNVDSLWTGDENPVGKYDHDHMGNYQNFGDLFIRFGGGAAKVTVPSGHDSFYSQEGVLQTMDGDPVTKWCVEHGNKPVVWQMNLPEGQSHAVTAYHFTSADDAPERDPKAWTLSGSDDGKHWTVLDARTDQPAFAKRGERRSYPVTAAKPYRFLRLTFDMVQGGIRFQLADIDLGIEAGPEDHEAADYVRALDLARAVHTVSYTKDGVAYRRETFCSQPDKVMVMRISADQPGALHGVIRLVDGRTNSTVAQDGHLSYRGTLSNGMRYEAQLKVLNQGGRMSADGEDLTFTGCDTLTCLLVADTDYRMDRASGWRGEDPHERLTGWLRAAAAKEYPALKRDHVADHQSFFNRVLLDLGKTPDEATTLPTDARIDRYNEKGDDRGLEAILFQYGRYLLIGSSREGTLPANLQGLWNNRNQPPWHADYHSNINVQMNYWLAETAGLPELARPLFDMLVAGAPVYQEHTKRQYGADKQGYVTRMSINPFGGSGWNWNIEGTAWLAQHFWEHYAFSPDRDFLEQTAWPWLRDVSLFWLDHLKALPDGQLVVPNVWSHEHGPYEDGTAHAQQLMWDLFSNTLAAARALDTDPALQKRLEETIGKLYGPKIGSWGQLMEWMGEKPKLEKSHHRHTSHLFAVFPGHQISRERTPEWAEAAEVSLRARGSTGDSRRSWTWPWRTAMWARFGEPEKCHEMIRGLFQYNMLDNLLATHPPLQLDGSFGITAGMCEMLLQSHAGNIVLLPALPEAWANGRVTGLRARGGYTVSVDWKDGQLNTVAVNASVAGSCTVQVGDKTQTLNLKAGESALLQGSSF